MIYLNKTYGHSTFFTNLNPYLWKVKILSKYCMVFGEKFVNNRIKQRNCDFCYTVSILQHRQNYVYVETGKLVIIAPCAEATTAFHSQSFFKTYSKTNWDHRFEDVCSSPVSYTHLDVYKRQEHTSSKRWSQLVFE